MKRLIVIPLVHVPFGVWESKRLEYTFGKDPNPVTVKKIIDGHKIYWDMVDCYLKQEHFDKVYQEGSEVEYSVQEFLEGFGRYKGKDRNVDAFFGLINRGVEFVRTESTYARNETNRRSIFEEPDELEPCDSFIAKNINNTLRDGQRGVLFLGVKHGVDIILNEKYQETKAERFHQDPSYLIDLLNSISVKHRSI